MCSQHKARDLLQQLYALLSQAVSRRRSPSYWVTTEGDRQPEELEPSSRRWLGRVRTSCARAPRGRGVGGVFYPDVHILATPAEGMDGATSGDPIVPLCVTAVIHAKHLWNTWQESVEDLLSHVSCVTDVVASTHKNIIPAAGALRVDFKWRFGGLVCVAFPTPLISDFPSTVNARSTEIYSSRQYV